MRRWMALATLLCGSCFPDYGGLRGSAGTADGSASGGADAGAVDGGLNRSDSSGADVPSSDGAGAGHGGGIGDSGFAGHGGTKGLGGTGAAQATGGTIGSGGAAGAGGMSGKGGVGAVGGASVGTGGIPTTGGAIGSGGTAGRGGATSGGGATSTGGMVAAGGTTAAGGTAGTGGRAGAGGSSCAAITAGPFRPADAHSAGFQGQELAYEALEAKACAKVSDCTADCLAAGGTTDFCTLGMRCEGNCHPPSYWEPEAGAGAPKPLPLRVDVVASSYHEFLVVSNFGVQVPADATITGIQFQLSRYTLSGQDVSDFSVRVLKEGQAVGLDRKRSEKWPAGMPVSSSYGDVNDSWGVTWTPQSVMSTGFGMSIAGLYELTAGNDWLYVTDVRAYVSYLPAHCP